MSGVLGTQAYIRYFDNPVSYRQGGITCSMPAGSLIGMSAFFSPKFRERELNISARILGELVHSGQVLAKGRPAGFLCSVDNWFDVSSYQESTDTDSEAEPF
jgi:hypothetical protein